jgi:hypothetical protein
MDDSIPRSTLNDLRRTFPARGRHALAAIIAAIAAAQLLIPTQVGHPFRNEVGR